MLNVEDIDCSVDHALKDNAHSCENRMAVRELLNTEIFVQQSGNKPRRVTLSDISSSGFRMTSKGSLDPLKPIFIRIPGIQSLSATIRWEGFKDYGCQFSQALTPSVFNNLLSKLKSLSN